MRLLEAAVVADVVELLVDWEEQVALVAWCHRAVRSAGHRLAAASADHLALLADSLALPPLWAAQV